MATGRRRGLSHPAQAPRSLGLAVFCTVPARCPKPVAPAEPAPSSRCSTRPRCARSCPNGKRSPPTRPSPTRSTSTGCCCPRSRPTARATSAASRCGTAARSRAVPDAAGAAFHGLPVRALGSWRHRNMLLCGMPLVRAKMSPTRASRRCCKARHAPMIEFDWVPAGGLFYGALAEAARRAACRGSSPTPIRARCCVRDRDPRARFNSNMKNNLRRWQARLAAHGELTPVRLAPGDDVAAWTEEFMRLEASGWKGRAGSALACREDDRRFVAAVFAEAFRRGRLLITGLNLDGRPLARHCMLTAGEGAFTFKIAYDETYEKCSPGILGEVDNVRQFMETPGRAGSTPTPRARTPATAACGRTAARCSASRSARAARAASRSPRCRCCGSSADGARRARVGLQRRRVAHADTATPRPPGTCAKRRRACRSHSRPAPRYPARHSMIVAIHQPHFLPWLGYLHRMAQVDAVRAARPRAVRAPQLPEPHHGPHERRGALAHRAGDPALAERAHRRQGSRQPPRRRASGGRRRTSPRCATPTARRRSSAPTPRRSSSCSRRASTGWST